MLAAPGGGTMQGIAVNKMLMLAEVQFVKFLFSSHSHFHFSLLAC